MHMGLFSHQIYTSLRNKQLLDQAYFFSKNQYIDQARIVRIVLTCTQQLDNKLYNIFGEQYISLLGND